MPPPAGPLVMLWPWPLTFDPKQISSSLTENAPMMKVWWKYVQHFAKRCVNDIRDEQTDRQTDAQTYEQPEYIKPPATMLAEA